MNIPSIMERLLDASPESLTDKEILEMILSFADSVADPKATAQEIMDAYITIPAVCEKPLWHLEHATGLGRDGALLIKLCSSLAFSLCGANLVSYSNPPFTEDTVKNMFTPFYSKDPTEQLLLMVIDSTDKIVGIERVCYGFSDHAKADMEKMVDIAVKYRAKKVVLSHNHSSGVCPSVADVGVTCKLGYVMASIDVLLCDHLIYCNGKYHSMKNHGEFKPLEDNIRRNGEL